MQAGINAMKIALRVLSALTDKNEPDEVDVSALRMLAPLLSSMPIDELACEVIQQAIRNRAEVRAMVARV